MNNISMIDVEVLEEAKSYDQLMKEYSFAMEMNEEEETRWFLSRGGCTFEDMRNRILNNIKEFVDEHTCQEM